MDELVLSWGCRAPSAPTRATGGTIARQTIAYQAEKWRGGVRGVPKTRCLGHHCRDGGE